MARVTDADAAKHSDESTIVTTGDAPAEAPAEDAPEAERAPIKQLNGVHFEAGQTDTRIMSAADLRNIGVDPKNEDDLVWNRDNGYTIPISSVNAATVDALIALPGFSAV